jgi:hypothetical protein
MQSNKCNTAYRIKDTKRVIIAVDSEKTFDKMQPLFQVKVLKKLGIEGKYINIIRAL